MIGLLAAAAEGTFKAPYLDYHALAPEIILTTALVVILLVDLVVDETRKYLVTQLAGIGLLASLIPIVTLAVDSDGPRSMFGGAYVVDEFSLVLKGLFLVTGYVIILMGTDYIGEGDYYEGEFSFLLLSSVLGMVVMSSSRDLITIFVALELLSIPAYMLAGWRKRDVKSNEAAMKYYLLGVLASAVMLYGMSLIFGATGSTILAEVGDLVAGAAGKSQVVTLGIFLVFVGFAFKVSAVPFHFWAPDTYEGAPTPVTAFFSVASKTGGFVAILQLVFVGFFGRADVWQPLFWVLAAATMTIGNLIALRQTNIVRMLAYSSIAQAGYILAPLAVAGTGSTEVAQSAQTALIMYLLIYAAMNLGAFTIVIAVARKTMSGEIKSYGGLFTYAPGLTVLMTVFVFSLAGIPPFGGWFAKLMIFRALIDGGGWSGVSLAVIAGVNSVIALFYYASIAKEMWMNPAPDGDRAPIRVPAALNAALGLTVVAVLVMGIYPQAFARMGDLASLLP